MKQGQEATGGANGCGTSFGCPDHGLHQPWCNRQDLSRFNHRCGAGPDGQGQPSPARSSGPDGCVLCDRTGAVHAVVLSRSVALSVGRSAVASRSIGRGASAGKSGISQARTRLGWEPLRQLHDELVKPIAVRSTRGAWYRIWRLVSVDGSTFDVADEKANEDAFSRPGASRGASVYPQIRFVSLVENGTHVLFGSQMDGYRTGEIT